ncbi:unnamed protein product [Rotaria magnacalcarata]|uniref:MULE transposase domain-containing protein n=1 Tax=Rotaria magnacalcarata TaxID=392030 RepID=A0A8S2PS86_9BILA|nr:unnamed protein product [Rotaria magnacalcarata]CAF4067295.1 unnamed protein product [Rotaria magnacalcarata]
MTGEHSHVPEKETIVVREFREKIKQQAIEETTPIPHIYDEECAKAMFAINKARRGVTPIIPTTQLFDIPDPFARTLRDNPFLIIDKLIARRQRMILFVSDEQLKMLFSAETILMDGTFSSCPKIFDQVYTIRTFPCVFGLLPNRLKLTYQFLFHELKSIAIQMKLDFAPKIVMSDFEPAFMGVVKTEFSAATHSSCYSHFTQAIYRNIQRLGLCTIYNHDDDVKHFCRQLMALPLLPEPVIEDTYDKLVRDLSTNMSKKMKHLLEYFREQWFAKVPMSQWCVHGLSMRTNNNAEAFHSRFNRRVLVHHPNIWSFIKFLQGEESRFYHMNIQFSAGLGARAKQAKTIAIQRRIDCLDKRYYDGLINVMEYLNGLSFTVAKRKK